MGMIAREEQVLSPCYRREASSEHEEQFDYRHSHLTIVGMIV
jgi:hypothetical protein